MDSDSQACRDTDPEVFFADADGDLGRVKAWEWAALAVCARCPVRELCLLEALRFAAFQQWGVVGGTTAAQRRQYLAEQELVGEAS